MSIYLDLTKQWNAGRTRAVICSGQAVVLLRLAIASKDGDWILREDQEALDHVLASLDARGAHYRFGAPLDLRWLRNGWSSHFEFQHEGMRVRTDFFTRPPRVSSVELAAMWRELDGRDPPFTGPRLLMQIKQTGREKDWPIVGQLARLLTDPMEQLLCSRSARDLIALAAAHPQQLESATRQRPALQSLGLGFDELRLALERERFAAMDLDAARIRAFVAATRDLERMWPELDRRTQGLPLRAAHTLVVESAERWLPNQVQGTSS